MTHEKLLKRLYYGTTSPVCFSGQQALYREARKKNKKIKLKHVTDFMHAQEVYTLTKKLNRRFTRNKTIASGYMTDWQADLADVSNLSDENDGYNYLFCCIDQLSRYAWAIPMKRKTAAECSKALAIVLTDGYVPFRLYTDMGGEFMGQFRTVLKKHDIKQIMTKNTETKCAMAERYIRTLKSRMWRAFYAQRSRRYVEILPKIVKAINNAYHTTIRCAPTAVNRQNAAQLRTQLYGTKITHGRCKFKVGDTVRITHLRSPFAKGYKGSFTKELFTITQCIPRQPAVYVLKDLAGDEIKGTFYEAELVKVLKHSGLYLIDKEIKKRTLKGEKQVYVSYDGYPAKFNQWINERDIPTCTNNTSTKPSR